MAVTMRKVTIETMAGPPSENPTYGYAAGRH